MSGNSIAHSATTATPPVAGTCETPVTPGRATRELGLKRSEFDLSVQLGHIRMLPDEGGGGPRVARAEMERLRSQEGFPETLRERVRTVGTQDAARILQVTPARFTRLARLGLLVPIAFYLNRYRTTVWLYLAQDIAEFADDEKHVPLLKRPFPEGLRDQLGAGLDLRARNWRGRRLGLLLRRSDGPWERAAAVASLLDPLQLAETVRDPWERAHLNRFHTRPPVPGLPGSPAAHLAEQIMTAQDRDEIDWLRADLARAVDEARTHQPAPRPAQAVAQSPHTGRQARRSTGRPSRPPERPGPSRPRARPDRGSRTHGLLGRLLRRSV
ncbi:DUF6397 family protein [Streptomyces sp. NPDC046985]|uniref:DUF6397 family protein n=1 Tax=Streptomyces sp. NPDC046985 TaxID=3155377 RepID=UPI00341037DF